MNKCLYPRQDEPHKVFFTWQITYNCNYKCTYCHTPKHGQQNVVDTVVLNKQEWIKIWNNIYDMYGECEINISGGEPSLYPDFFEIVKEITQKHKAEIVTNLSFDIDKKIYDLNPERVRIAASFHPQYTDIESFVNKIKKVKQLDFVVTVNFVPWPPFFNKINYYKKVFDENSINVVLQPFIGIYNGKKYPESYNDDEKNILNLFRKMGNEKILKFKLMKDK